MTAEFGMNLWKLHSSPFCFADAPKIVSQPMGESSPAVLALLPTGFGLCKTSPLSCPWLPPQYTEKQFICYTSGYFQIHSFIVALCDRRGGTGSESWNVLPRVISKQEFTSYSLSKSSFFSSTAWLGFIINCKDLTLGNGQKTMQINGVLYCLIVIYLSKYSFTRCYYVSKCVIFLLLGALALWKERL